MTNGTDIAAGTDTDEPWTRVPLTVAEYGEEARAALDAMEAKAVAELREVFAAQRRSLESDLLRLGRDLAIQRGEVH